MTDPYRTQALALPEQRAARPKWRIVKLPHDNPELPYRWVLQRRFLWFWWRNIDWQYSLALCLKDYQKKTNPPRATVVWDDVRGAR